MKHRKHFLWIICIILFFIPFLWLRPGEMDLGGDDTRLYFYDPFHFLQNVIYAIIPSGIGSSVETAQYPDLPFIIVLILLKLVIRSSYLIITLYNSLLLVGSFFFTYAIVRDLLQIGKSDRQTTYHTELASIFAGLFYILGPMMNYSGWTTAYIFQAVIFLNPLMFFLLLRFFHTNKTFYLAIALFISFIFAFCFGWFAAPYLLSFYPFAVGFIIVSALFVYRVRIRLKGLVIAAALFMMMHAFHIYPIIAGLFKQSASAYTFAFGEASYTGGIFVFNSFASGTTLLKNLLAVPQHIEDPTPYAIAFFLIPLIIILGFMLNGKIKDVPERQRKLSFLLLGVIFLIICFFVTANITGVGFKLYQQLFHIPGFNMFRYHYVKWLHSYIFFTSVVFGIALFYVISYIKKKMLSILLFVGLLVLLLASSFTFIRGDRIRSPLYYYEPETAAPIIMDPDYEHMLEYIRRDPVNGRYFTIPFTEFYTPMVSGTEGGIYFGPSMISNLTGRVDINGHSPMNPFGGTFIELIAKKDYQSIVNLFSLLNIKYIFYNSDPAIDKLFPDWPYRGDIRKNFPPDSKTMTNFLNSMPVKEKISFGSKYHIYEMNDEAYLPHIYVAKKIDTFSRAEMFLPANVGNYTKDAFYKSTPDYERRTVFLEEEEGEHLPKEFGEQTPKITVTKVNITRYEIKVENAQEPYMLVFSNGYLANWSLFLLQEQTQNKTVVASYFDGDIKETAIENIWFNKDTFSTWMQKPIVINTHFRANGYANSWYITPADTQGKQNYTLILELISQRDFYVGIVISIIGLVVYLGWVSILLWKMAKKNKIAKI